MADSVRQQIFIAIETMLQAVDGIGQVSRGKIDPLVIQNYPAAFIMPGYDQVADEMNTLITRDMQVFVFLWFRSQIDIHLTLEAFLPKVQQTVAADHTLGGKTIDINETAIEQPFPLNDEQTEAGVVMELRVLYRTRRDNPYLQG